MKKLIAVLVTFVFLLMISVISALAQTSIGGNNSAPNIGTSLVNNSSGGTVGGPTTDSGQAMPKNSKKRDKKTGDVQKQEDTDNIKKYKQHKK